MTVLQVTFSLKIGFKAVEQWQQVAPAFTQPEVPVEWRWWRWRSLPLQSHRAHPFSFFLDLTGLFFKEWSTNGPTVSLGRNEHGRNAPTRPIGQFFRQARFLLILNLKTVTCTIILAVIYENFHLTFSCFLYVKFYNTKHRATLNFKRESLSSEKGSLREWQSSQSC